MAYFIQHIKRMLKSYLKQKKKKIYLNNPINRGSTLLQLSFAIGLTKKEIRKKKKKIIKGKTKH